MMQSASDVQHLMRNEQVSTAESFHFTLVKVLMGALLNFGKSEVCHFLVIRVLRQQ